MIKRQGLVPFPRVGRAGNGHNNRYWTKSIQDMGKRATGGSGASSMWFGPRLGKIQKRSADYYQGEQM